MIQFKEINNSVIKFGVLILNAINEHYWRKEMKLKRGRYWVFAFNKDNAKGGLDDLKSSFNTIKEFEESILSLNISEFNTYQILDTHTKLDFKGDIGTITKWVCKNIGDERYEEDIC